MPSKGPAKFPILVDPARWDPGRRQPGSAREQDSDRAFDAGSSLPPSQVAKDDESPSDSDDAHEGYPTVLSDDPNLCLRNGGLRLSPFLGLVLDGTTRTDAQQAACLPVSAAVDPEPGSQGSGERSTFYPTGTVSADGIRPSPPSSPTASYTIGTWIPDGPGDKTTSIIIDVPYPTVLRDDPNVSLRDGGLELAPFLGLVPDGGPELDAVQGDHQLAAPIGQPPKAGTASSPAPLASASTSAAIDQPTNPPNSAEDTCEHCGQPFSSSSQRSRHMRAEHKGVGLPGKATSASQRRRSVQYNPGGRAVTKHKCIHCNLALATQFELKAHLMMVHDDQTTGVQY